MYLGYYGERVRSSATKPKEFDWFTSCFGGPISALQSAIIRDWPSESDSTDAQLSVCDCCKKPLLLVAQIHAPQSLCSSSTPLSGLAAIADNSILSPNYKPPQGEDDEELRVLIILCCNEKRCWKVGRATWKAYRYQPHVVITEEEAKRIKEEKAAAYRKTLQTPVYKDEEATAGAKKTPSVTPTKSVFSTPQWSSPFGGGFSSPPAKSVASVAESTPSSSSTQDIEQLLKLRDMSISPQGKKGGNGGGAKSSPSGPSASSSSSSNVASSSSSLPSIPKEESISRATVAESSEAMFEEAYIEFDKEPEIASYSGSYEKYEKKAQEPLAEGADGSWAGEGYESSVSAKDKPFHRFHKRLQRAPEQCLRYWRGAEPLYSAANIPKQVPSCPNCGAKRVPETQLTPALIYFLKPNQAPLDSNLEFGTVIFYSCSANCTDQRKPLHAEHIEIQRGM